MALLNYTKRDEATGEMANIYEMLEDRIKFIPNVVQFHSVSPEMFTKFMNLSGHYIDHPTLDPITVAYIRFLISAKEKGEYCVRFQSFVLQKYNVTEDDLIEAHNDYYKINLDTKRKDLVCFVMDEMYDNLFKKIDRINRLKDLGWTEKDIYEASILGAIQKGMVKVINTFEVEFDF